MNNRKIALITGGSRGLGRAMALKLAERGTDVIITYRTEKAKADEVVREMEAKGAKALALPFDAGNMAALNEFVGSVREGLRTQWGTERFDILINNAGMGATIPFEAATEQDFDSFMNTHFKSVYFLCQRTLPILNDGGRIINISTGTTRFANPGYSIYASMKGAVEVFTRYLAKEVGRKGITVNVVAPGPVETDFNNAAIRNAPPERRQGMMANTALGRMATADDISGVIAFLCSDDSAWVSGQRIEASGGINL